MLSNLLSSGGRMAVYCPQWVYAACVGLTARDFLVKDIPIDLVARRYSKGLLDKYDEVNPIEIASIAEDIIRILAEVEAGKTCEREANCKGPCMQDSKPGVPVWMGENSKCAEEAQGTAASPFNLLSLCDQAAAAADYGDFYFKPDEGAPEEGPGT